MYRRRVGTSTALTMSACLKSLVLFVKSDFRHGVCVFPNQAFLSLSDEMKLNNSIRCRFPEFYSPV